MCLCGPLFIFLLYQRHVEICGRMWLEHAVRSQISGCPQPLRRRAAAAAGRRADDDPAHQRRREGAGVLRGSGDVRLPNGAGVVVVIMCRCDCPFLQQLFPWLPVFTLSFVSQAVRFTSSCVVLCPLHSPLPHPNLFISENPRQTNVLSAPRISWCREI